MKRNLEKLLESYEKKFGSAPARQQRGQITVWDYRQIITMADAKSTAEDGTYKGGYGYNCVDIALRAGIMIGYNARKAEEEERRTAAKQKRNSRPVKERSSNTMNSASEL